MRAEPNYRGFEIEVTAVQDERGWNARGSSGIPWSTVRSDEMR